MNTTRRTFVKSFLGGAVAVSTLPFLTGCGNITRKDIQTQNNIIPNENLDATLYDILYYASLAPSGHNAQPWFVKLLDNRNLIIGVEPKRRLPAVDPDNRETLLGIGAFLENLSIAAAVMGFEAQIEIIAKNPLDTEIAKVSLQKSAPVNYPLSRLTQRTTVRKNLLNKDLKEKDVKELGKYATGNFNYYNRNSEHSKYIIDAQIETYRVQAYRKDAMEELKHWFRLNNSDAEKYRDGLTLAGMGISGFPGWYIRNFMNNNDMVSESSLKISTDMNEAVVKEGAGWIVITSNSSGVSGIVDAGRKFEKIALAAIDQNIAIAPMMQILEEKKGKELFKTHHKPELIPQFILRVGYLDKYPEPVSLRRPVNWFIRK